MSVHRTHCLVYPHGGWCEDGCRPFTRRRNKRYPLGGCTHWEEFCTYRVANVCRDRCSYSFRRWITSSSYKEIQKGEGEQKEENQEGEGGKTFQFRTCVESCKDAPLLYVGLSRSQHDRTCRVLSFLHIGVKYYSFYRTPCVTMPFIAADAHYYTAVVGVHCL